MATWTLITGASEGLGVEFAHIAAREKRNVILAARSRDKLEKVAGDVRALGVEALVIPADLSDMAKSTGCGARPRTGATSTCW